MRHCFALPLLQVLLEIAGPALEAMPFGAPVAAILGAVYARAATVSHVFIEYHPSNELAKYRRPYKPLEEGVETNFLCC